MADYTDSSDKPAEEQQTTAKARYTALETKREPFLRRARDCSELTIPTLIPRDGQNGSTDYHTPYQAMGARGVNNLASKLLLSQFPANQTFVRFVPSAEAADQAEKAGAKDDMEDGLAKLERKVVAEIEAMALRPGMFEGFKHLLHGNVLLDFSDDTHMKVWPLAKYVVSRDGLGNILEIVTRECVSPLALPEETMDQVLGGDAYEKNSTAKEVEVYTHIKRETKNWSVYQEVKGIRITGSDGVYPKDCLPFLPLRLIRVDGEDYGRGYVEEYQGDLQSLEGLMRAIVQGSAAAAKVLFLLKPNATTTLKSLSEAPNGAFRQGMPEDVTAVQMNKQGDFTVALNTIAKLEERLSYAFLLNSSVQRNGERVTAAEIRYMAEELEDALGGVYSILAQELQLPLVNLVVYRMQKAKTFPKFDKKLLKPTIITGLEALGRGNDLNKLKTFTQEIVALNPEFAAKYIKFDVLSSRMAAAIGIDTQGLIKSEEEVQQAEQQTQMSNLVSQVAPHVAKPFAEAAAQGGVQPSAPPSNPQQAQ